jgi:hypothetical protein
MTAIKNPLPYYLTQGWHSRAMMTHKDDNAGRAVRMREHSVLDPASPLHHSAYAKVEAPL